MHDDFAKYFLIGFFSHEDDGRERNRERERERDRERERERERESRRIF